MKANEKTHRFGRPISFIVVLFPLLLVNSVILKKCTCNKTGKIVTLQPVKAPVAISFRDANRLLQLQIPSVKVTLIDDGGQVVTPNGLSFSSLEIKGGVMVVALKDSAIFNRERPYRFTVKTEAPGYSTNYRSIVIRENKEQYIPVYMAKTDDPPPGMAGFTGFIPISNSKSKANLTLLPDKINQLNRKVSVFIPDSTIFLNNDKPVNDSISQISYNISFASPKSIAALRTFPGGGGSLVTDALDLQKREIATPGTPFFFASSGWMTLEMKAGVEEINRFSQPIDLVLPIEDSLINTQTQQLFKEGDEITTWSLNDRGVWQQENQVVVENSKDGLVAKMRIRHLSTWNLDSKLPNCTLLIDYTNGTGGNLDAYSELVGTTNGVPFLAFGPNPITYSSAGGTLDIVRAPQGVNATFVVYDNESEATSSRAATGQFTMCPTIHPIVNISPIPTSRINISFQVVDVADPSMPKNICKNAVWYRECAGCIPLTCQMNSINSFLFGGMLKPDAMTPTDPASATLYRTTGAVAGTYCIRLWYGMRINAQQTMADEPETVDLVIEIPAAAVNITVSNQEAKVSVPGGGVPQNIRYDYSLQSVTTEERNILITLYANSGGPLSFIPACN